MGRGQAMRRRLRTVQGSAGRRGLGRVPAVIPAGAGPACPRCGPFAGRNVDLLLDAGHSAPEAGHPPVKPGHVRLETRHDEDQPARSARERHKDNAGQRHGHRTAGQVAGRAPGQRAGQDPRQLRTCAGLLRFLARHVHARNPFCPPARREWHVGTRRFKPLARTDKT